MGDLLDRLTGSRPDTRDGAREPRQPHRRCRTNVRGAKKSRLTGKSAFRVRKCSDTTPRNACRSAPAPWISSVGGPSPAAPTDFPDPSEKRLAPSPSGLYGHYIRTVHSLSSPFLRPIFWCFEEVFSSERAVSGFNVGHAATPSADRLQSRSKIVRHRTTALGSDSSIANSRLSSSDVAVKFCDPTMASSRSITIALAWI